MLLYTSKGVTATNQFKVHGQLPLHGMIVSRVTLYGEALETPHVRFTLVFVSVIESVWQRVEIGGA